MKTDFLKSVLIPWNIIFGNYSTNITKLKILWLSIGTGMVEPGSMLISKYYDSIESLVKLTNPQGMADNVARARKTRYTQELKELAQVSMVVYHKEGYESHKSTTIPLVQGVVLNDDKSNRDNIKIYFHNAVSNALYYGRMYTGYASVVSLDLSDIFKYDSATLIRIIAMVDAIASGNASQIELTPERLKDMFCITGDEKAVRRKVSAIIRTFFLEVEKRHKNRLIIKLKRNKRGGENVVFKAIPDGK